MQVEHIDSAFFISDLDVAQVLFELYIHYFLSDLATELTRLNVNLNVCLLITTFGNVTVNVSYLIVLAYSYHITEIGSINQVAILAILFAHSFKLVAIGNLFNALSDLVDSD